MDYKKISDFHANQMEAINDILSEKVMEAKEMQAEMNRGKEECEYCEDTGRVDRPNGPDDSYEDFCDCPAGDALRDTKNGI